MVTTDSMIATLMLLIITRIYCDSFQLPVIHNAVINSSSKYSTLRFLRFKDIKVCRKQISNVNNNENHSDKLKTTGVVSSNAGKLELNERLSENRKRKYVVIGGGWGGWGAAKTLCEMNSNCQVILLDSSPDPTGETPYLSKTGKPVEAGTKGFWKDYPNINRLCDELGLDQNKIFTSFTNSSLFSPDGLEATTPVFAEAKFLSNPFVQSISKIMNSPSSQLPSPFGQILATLPLCERIPILDRASLVGLMIATIDCLGSDESVQEKYDRMTAHELFIRFGLTKRIVDDFMRPILLVGLFKPPEEISALVAIEFFYYFCLAHQDSFDVRWMKNGTVNKAIIAPLASMLQMKYDFNILGGCVVGEISLAKDNVNNDKLAVSKITYKKADGTDENITDIDGAILAVGCKGMRSIVNTSKDLARIPTFAKAASLKGIDVISTRIWFDRVVPTRTPSNVFSRFDELRGAGGTFFMLDQLQEDIDELWGYNTTESSKRGSVVACDFYNACGLLTLSDEDIIKVLTEKLLPSADPKFADAKVLDSWVGKYAGAVSWFSPGSYTSRPPLDGAGDDILPNLKIAGDWVRMGDREHGAKGLCQERAYVSGIEAANSLLISSLSSAVGIGGIHENKVLPIRDDEILFKTSVEFNKNVMQYFPRLWVR